MLRYRRRRIVKGLPLGKEWQRVPGFLVLRLSFEGRPVAAVKVFPTVRKYGLSLCGKELSCTIKNRRNRFKDMRLGGGKEQTRPRKGKDILLAFRPRVRVSLDVYKRQGYPLPYFRPPALRRVG